MILTLFSLLANIVKIPPFQVTPLSFSRHSLTFAFEIQLESLWNVVHALMWVLGPLKQRSRTCKIKQNVAKLPKNCKRSNFLEVLQHLFYFT